MGRCIRSTRACDALACLSSASEEDRSLPSVGQVVERGKASGEMIRLLIRRRHGHAKADALGYGGHGRDDGQGLGDWPLGARCGSRIQRLLIHVVAACITRQQQSYSAHWGSRNAPSTSAMKMPWNLASSSSLASSIQCCVWLNFHDSSSGCLQRPGD